MIVFTVLKVGLVDMSTSPDEVQTNNEAFPNPVGALTGTSYGLRLVHWTINPQNRGEIFLVSFISLVLALLLIELAIRTIPGKFERILVSVAVFLGPIAVVLLGNVGRNDIFLLVGSVLVAVRVPVNPPRPNGDQNPTRRIIYFVGGGVLMFLGNPEQMVFAMFIFSLITLTATLRHLRKYALCGFALALIGAVLMTI